MKITKLMLSALVAAAALVSCNKENHMPEVGNGVKTVNMSIGNLLMTKGLAGDAIASGTPVVVNDFQVFLTEASGTHLYNEGVMTLGDGTTYQPATFYWSNKELQNATAFDYDYHFVSPHCTKIIVVANVGKQITLAEAKNLGAAIEGQQDSDNLLLFGEDTLEPQLENGEQVIHQGTDNDGDKFYSEVYSATPVLYPTIARFEVDGFAMNFDGDALSEVAVTDILFQDYITTMTAGIPGTTYHTLINNLDSDADVYYWFNNTTDDDTDATWYRDSFTDMILTKPATATEGTHFVDRAPITLTDGTASPRAYHMFAPANVPDMVIKMMTASEDANGNIVKSDAYVYTATFLDSDGKALTSIEPGVIYRMSGRADVGDNKGFIDIDEEDLNTVDRCIDITVDVHKWEVVLVTPEF